MHKELQAWQSSGSYITFGPQQFNIFTRDIGDKNADAHNTLLLIHGFPESSYSFHLVLDGLRSTFDRVVVYDMLGYGLSDKPLDGYSYSLFEQADLAFSVWHELGVVGGHILSHDMGDSVATEILARHENNLLPGWMKEGIQSMTFTNGSMILGLAKLRLTQKILLSPLGHMMSKLVSYNIFMQQVMSAHGNQNLTEEEIKKLWLMNTQKDGHRMTYLTIKYLHDRKRFETSRWLPALGKTTLPIHICWGDHDAVARVEMAYYLKKHICPQATLTIMQGLGHFCQLGHPEKWVSYVCDFYRHLTLKSSERSTI